MPPALKELTVKRERLSIGELIITALWTNALTEKPKACVAVCICVCVCVGAGVGRSGGAKVAKWTSKHLGWTGKFPLLSPALGM